jgi:hypothetical protein
MSSGFAPLAPIANWFLPDGMQQAMPVGGLQVAIPKK